MKMYKFYVLTSDNDRSMKQVRKKKRGMNEGEREREQTNRAENVTLAL